MNSAVIPNPLLNANPIFVFIGSMLPVNLSPESPYSFMNPLTDSLIKLEDSTTYFLESLHGKALELEIDSQSEEFTGPGCIIKRMVKLYFQSAMKPALYCESHIYRDALTDEEYRLLVNSAIPIGKLFKILNDRDAIQKRNITVTADPDLKIAAIMNVAPGLLWKKQYDYWVGNRHIGLIIEYFNEESLTRL